MWLHLTYAKTGTNSYKPRNEALSALLQKSVVDRAWVGISFLRTPVMWEVDSLSTGSREILVATAGKAPAVNLFLSKRKM